MLDNDSGNGSSAAYAAVAGWGSSPRHGNKTQQDLTVPEKPNDMRHWRDSVNGRSNPAPPIPGWKPFCILGHPDHRDMARVHSSSAPPRCPG